MIVLRKEAKEQLQFQQFTSIILSLKTETHRLNHVDLESGDWVSHKSAPAVVDEVQIDVYAWHARHAVGNNSLTKFTRLQPQRDRAQGRDLTGVQSESHYN